MKTAQSTIQLRIDSKTKRQAQKTLEEIGLDFSSAIKLFLKRVILTESIPFEIKTKNGFTLAQEAEFIREVEIALESKKAYKSIEDAHADILK